MNTLDTLYSAAQAAEFLGMTRSSVIAAIRCGRLKANKVGVQWVMTAPDLEAFKAMREGRAAK